MKPHRREPGPKRTVSWFAVIGVSGLLACVTTWTPRPVERHQRTAPVDNAGEYVGAEECGTCHEDIRGHAIGPAYHGDCETCHGPGELHAESEEIADIRYPSNSECASCHESGGRTLNSWMSSGHARSGVLCSDCHDTHGAELRQLRSASPERKALLRHADASSQMCATCHTDVAASLALPSHHPVREGGMSCTDCHRPHESEARRLGSATDACTGCHRDLAGPWIFEHAPVAEDCMSCHTPHGANSRALLQANEPASCITCHSLPAMGAAHDPYAFSTRCSDCHSAVHGSFSDPHLRR